jgi:hypothetical protein
VTKEMNAWLHYRKFSGQPDEFTFLNRKSTWSYGVENMKCSLGISRTFYLLPGNNANEGIKKIR